MVDFFSQYVYIFAWLSFHFYVLIYIVKNIQQLIDFYKIAKKCFSNSNTRKYCKNPNFLKKYYFNLFFISICHNFDCKYIRF